MAMAFRIDNSDTPTARVARALHAAIRMTPRGVHAAKEKIARGPGVSLGRPRKQRLFRAVRQPRLEAHFALALDMQARGLDRAL